MNKCTVCDETTLGHRCRGCGEIHCESHILPENHDCVSLYVDTTDGKWFNTQFETLGEDTHREQPETKSVAEINASSTEDDEPTPDPDKNYTVAEANDNNPNYQNDSEYETVDVEEGQVYGTAEPEYESSPDVNLDGSIKTDESGAELDEIDDVDTRWLSNGQLVIVGIVVFCLLAYIFYLI
ncbi:Cellobiohydrolase A (1,4-beta-cellobiosidase A) [Halohasta litchfieldiae]|jgi:hypothetical protein|uniref:AN1-like Zinc finger n=1 Tax=Halohasta litchfieldiae TaxID=1073996 RepID=A0A1H6XXP5_9EURY|nr:hypothetical protein [Halohasta litchfieldiae]ATW88209.1 Cellobiohydrolase A (1,4-beta-cellobiosidase A) [Halohasta litchfieldiae]SEJ32404.1 AN1-like Zinc finger [Halohasta litchfieldiae]